MKKQLIVKALSLIMVMSSGVLLLSFLFMGCQPPDEDTQHLSFFSSNLGTPLYMIAGSKAHVIGDIYPEIQITVEVSAGGPEGARQVGKEQAELAFCPTPVSQDVLLGEGKWMPGEHYPNIRYVLGGVPMTYHIFALKELGIEDLYDIKGLPAKPGIVITAMGPAYTATIEFLQLYGLEKDVHYSVGPPKSLSDALDDMRDGVAQIAFILAPYPQPFIQELELSRELTWISSDEKMVQKFIDTVESSVVIGVIPAGTYSGQDKDLIIPTPYQMLITHENVDEDIIYKVTKAIIENTDKLAETHPVGYVWNIENTFFALPEGALLHPGAERYFREVGALP